jgi:uncharacterized protein YdaT
MDVGSVHLKMSSLAASTMTELYRNISTNEIKAFIFNSDPEEHCTLNVSVAQ